MESPIESMNQEEKDVLLHQLAYTVNSLQQGYLDLNTRVSSLENLLKESLNNLPEWKLEAITLKAKGMNNTAISNKTGISRQSVSKFLNKTEIKVAIELQTEKEKQNEISK